MISPLEIQKIAKQWNIADFIIENDYVLGWLLWGISQNTKLKLSWVLKGGSAIKKCYVDNHRYTQDLDFTVLPGGLWKPEELFPIFEEITKQVSEASGINFNLQDPKFVVRPHGESCEGRIYYVGPRGNPNPTAIKLDITQAEDLIHPPTLRTISHPYSDSFPNHAQVYCYSLEELFAEKIRSLEERARPSDLYDIIYLFRRSDLNAEPELISEILGYKCDYKNIPTPQIAEIYTFERQEEIRKRWGPMLSRRVGLVSAFDEYWIELPKLFAWLNGEDYEIVLLPIDKDKSWSAPALTWQRGQSELIEPIRHAAVNRLTIKLGYGNDYRLVEPYSLRITRGNNILFYAIKLETREIRAYRLDRIQSIEVTNQPYKPVFQIEFTPEGRIPVPPVARQIHYRVSDRSQHRYVIQCAVCGKRFYRSKYNARITSHKQKDSTAMCFGRYGFLV